MDKIKDTDAPVVVAVGGNALNGSNGAVACSLLDKAAANLAEGVHGPLVLTHGNGPQIGELALLGNDAPQQSLDQLGAETEGLIGYLLEQSLGNFFRDKEIATVITRIQVDANDEAFAYPTKPIGAWLSRTRKQQLKAAYGWPFKERNGLYRRLVPSPIPQKILQINTIKLLVDHGVVVICAGGGGIPVVRENDGHVRGIDGVIDKDLASALLATKLNARLLILATDVDAVYSDWQGERQKRICRTTPAEINQLALEPGSMGPKVKAACEFANSDASAQSVIGAFEDLAAILAGHSGTWISQ